MLNAILQMAEIVLLAEYVLLATLSQLLVALGSECTGHQLRCNDGEGCYSDEQVCTAPSIGFNRIRWNFALQKLMAL